MMIELQVGQPDSTIHSSGACPFSHHPHDTAL